MKSDKQWKGDPELQADVEAKTARKRENEKSKEK